MRLVMYPPICQRHPRPDYAERAVNKALGSTESSGLGGNRRNEPLYFGDEKPQRHHPAIKGDAADLRRRYPIQTLGVFGSYARGDQRDGSDLDILVEFGDGMTLLDCAGLQDELSRALGVKVDLANRRTLKPRIGERILSEVRML
jgi:uncharacterized protein